MSPDNSVQISESQRTERDQFDAIHEAEATQQAWGTVPKAIISKNDFGAFQSAPALTPLPGPHYTTSPFASHFEAEGKESDSLLPSNRRLEPPLIEGFDTAPTLHSRPLAASAFARILKQLPFKTTLRIYANEPASALAEFERDITIEERLEIADKESQTFICTSPDEDKDQQGNTVEKVDDEIPLHDKDDLTERAAPASLHDSQKEMFTMMEEERGIWGD
jgi:hypothetical protein